MRIKKILSITALSAVIILNLGGCTNNEDSHVIDKGQLETLVRNVAVVASSRFTGDTEIVRESLEYSFSDTAVEHITNIYTKAYVDEFIPLEGYIKDIEYAIVEDQTIGFIPNGDGTYMSMWDEGNPDAPYEQTHIKLDIKQPEELGILDPRIETVNGIRGIYSSRIPSDSNGKADIIIYNQIVNIEVNTKTALLSLIGNRNYNFKVESYNYFDNGTVIINLKTKDYAPTMIPIENGDADPAEIPDGEVTEYFTLVIKGTLDPDTLKFTPTEESLKLLTEPIEIHR